MLPFLFALHLKALTGPAAIKYRWNEVLSGGLNVAIALPTQGPRAFVAAGGSGYVLKDSTQRERIPMEQVTDVAVGDYAPDLVVAVGRANSGGNLRFSVDGGASWRPCAHPPAFEGGHIAISSDGRTWVWSGTDGARRSRDFGFTWAVCGGVGPEDRIVADRTSSRRFYALSKGTLLVSEDGGGDFEESRLVLPAGEEPVDVVPTPGRVGDLWLVTQNALYRATPGRAFARVPGVTDPTALGFGLASKNTAAPGSLHRWLFLAATAEGRSGLFRSDDEGTHWVELGGARLVTAIVSISGDPRRAGAVYVAGRDGRILQGSPRP